mgnify:CR=1 FL=1
MIRQPLPGLMELLVKFFFKKLNKSKILNDELLPAIDYIAFWSGAKVFQNTFFFIFAIFNIEIFIELKVNRLCYPSWNDKKLLKRKAGLTFQINIYLRVNVVIVVPSNSSWIIEMFSDLKSAWVKLGRGVVLGQGKGSS